LSALISTLRGMGFEPHLTSLGGSGLGVLQRGSTSASSTDFVSTSEGDVKEGMTVPKRATIRDVGRDGLAQWAQGEKWVY